MPSGNKIIYNKLTNLSLLILWIGTLLLLLAMIYNWRTTNLGAKSVFANQPLSPSQNLELGKSVNLINISLNRESAAEVLIKEDSVINEPPEKKLSYPKVKNTSNKTRPARPVKKDDGFDIKPLPK